MKLKLFNRKSKKFVILNGTEEECREMMLKEIKSRGWIYIDCYSEKLED